MSYYYSHEFLNHPIKSHHGPESQLSELAIFDSPGIQNEVEQCYWDKVYCQEPGLDLSNDEVIFDVKPSNDPISLCDSYMQVKVKLQKLDDNDRPINPDPTTDFVGKNI